MDRTQLPYPPMALSVQQPWAWLIVNGYKPVENRPWQTTLRGPLAIHASKKFDAEGADWVHDNFGGVIHLPTTFDMGGIVGEVELVDCVTKHDSEWFFGPFGFVFTNATPRAFRPCRGQLGFFRWPLEPVPALAIQAVSSEGEK